MKTPFHGKAASLITACTLYAASSFSAQAQVHSGAGDPAGTHVERAAVVRELFVRYAAGDLHGASALWVAGAPAENFVRRHRARLEKRCLRLESLTIDAVPGDRPVFDATSTTTVRTAQADSPEWWESARSRVTLERDGEGWRIASWEPREEELLDRLLAAGSATEQQAILDASQELQTTTFVRLAAQRGVDLMNQGREGEAGTITSAAFAVAQRLGDPVSLSASLSAKSIVLRNLHLLDEAYSTGEEAVTLAAGSGNPDVLARALVRWTRTREIRDGVPPQELGEQALALSGQLEEVSIAAHAAIHLGRVYELRGQYGEAFRYAELASTFAEESGDLAARSAASRLLDGAYRWIGDVNLAERHGRRAEAIAREGKFGYQALGVNAAAESTAVRGNLTEAFRILDSGLETTNNPRLRAMLFSTRAHVHALAGKFDEAERDLARSEALLPADPAWQRMMALARGAFASQRGDDEGALLHLEGARGPEVGFDRLARQYRAEILMRHDRLAEARELLQGLTGEGDVAEIIDPQRSLFHVLAHPTHRMLAELLVLQGDIPAALNVSEQLKGNELRAVLLHGKNAAVMAPENQEHERSLDRRIRELNRRLLAGKLSTAEAAGVRNQITDARADLLDFRQRLYAMQPASRAAHDGAICADELPAYLDDVTIISYLTGPATSFVFVLEPKRNGQRELIVRPIALEETRLNERVTRLATLVGQRNLRAPAAAAEMYDLLLRPVESSIEGARSLCIIPDSTLWHVPFQILGADGGPLLVDRVPLFYAQSIAVLAAAVSKREERRPDQRKPRLLAFANPTVEAETASLYRAFDPDAPLGAIPETESEVRAIAEIYGSDASRVYVGSAARETVLKQQASRFDILHIATHGVVYDNSPMFSALLLTASPGDPQDDGVLEAREIAALALDADLTVLSACETGRAGSSAGGGVIGLAWAFLAAGSPTIVVSQWKAHSAATATLMVEFHRQLAGGSSKPEALRRAQLALRSDRRYRHPFYWAPFAVVGVP